MKAERPARGAHEPGTWWWYNNWDFNVAGAIFERCAGQGVHEAFAQRIAAPLGMRDFTGRIVALPDGAGIPDWADGMRQLEDDHTGAMSRLKAENEMLLVRHRVYKLMAEHYARMALRLDPQTFATHRDRVLQHILFQRRKGVLPDEVRAADVAFLML